MTARTDILLAYQVFGAVSQRPRSSALLARADWEEMLLKSAEGTPSNDNQGAISGSHFDVGAR
jgi:hypothetical protein